MQVWITKYALTQGVYEVVARECDTAEGMIQQIEPKVMFGYFQKPDWHRTRAEAMAHAEKMRTKKIASLKASLAKFERMVFA